VFVYERLTSSRRWQPYALRAAFVAAILLGLLLLQTDHSRPVRGSLVSLRDLAVIGEQTYRRIVVIELTLILLVAPAATAGAVCLDKARGTLDHMLVTDLSNAEIVLGKLGVRLISVLGLVACVLPVLALTGLLGGIDPMALGGSFLVAIGCAIVGCSLAMTLSVYGRKTHEVLMLTYLIIIVRIMAGLLVEIVHWMLMGPPPPRAAGPNLWAALHDWAEWSNPYYLALAPYTNPGRVGVADYPEFLAGCLACSVALVGLATVRIRRVAQKQAGRPAAGARRWLSDLRRPRWWPELPGPSLDANPVAWREWHRTRPSWMMRLAWGLYAAFGLLWAYLASQARASGLADEAIGMMNMFQVALGLLLVCVGASTSLAEERVRGSLDVLLSTPVSTWSILAAKWWGSFRRVGPVAFWPAAAAAFPALAGGQWLVYVMLPAVVLAYGAAITSVGLAVATWVRRPGRAVAVCVAAYVILVVGLPILLVLLMPDANDPFEFGMILGDPPCGALILTAILTVSGGLPLAGGARFTATEAILWALIWIVAYIGAAMLLFGATVATSDGRLGRIPDDGVRPPSRRPGHSSLSTAELLALVPSSSEGFPEDPEAEDE
jgi:ABC-type transport system involved in multi-copper enzyme maturation permease subunit